MFRAKTQLKFLVGVIGALAVSSASGAVIINVANTPTDFNTNFDPTPSATIQAAAGQKLYFNITATAGDQIQGASIYLQIDDGGAGNGGTANTMGGHTVPTMAAINAMDLTGGVFTGNNSGNLGDQSFSGGLVAFDAVNTTSMVTTTVPGSGELGTVTLDASNMTPGSSFIMNLYDVGRTALNGDPGDPGNSSFYSNVSNTPFNFSGNDMSHAVRINIAPAPEPASLALLGVGAAGMFLRRRRSV